MNTSYRIEGFKFAALQLRLRKNIAGAVNNAGKSCEEIGQQLSPVASGFMRDNIKQIEEATPDKLRAVVESGADYSVFVEYGTVNQDAQPFFTPAFESARRQLNNELLQVLR
jgi:HK97 gp10 family phage protein